MNVFTFFCDDISGKTQKNFRIILLFSINNMYTIFERQWENEKVKKGTPDGVPFHDFSVGNFDILDLFREQFILLPGEIVLCYP